MSVLQFGEFQFDPALSRLSKELIEVNLDPRQVALLQYFLENPQRIINRDELQSEIWNGIIVTDNAINKLVANLRKALGDDAKEPTYIQTVPKLGYRFVCQVTSVECEPKSTSFARQPSLSERKPSSLWLISALFVLTVVAVYLTINVFSTARKYGDTQTLSRFHGSKSSPVFIDSSANMLFINSTQRGKTLWLSDGKTAVPSQINMGDHNIDALINYQEGELLYKGYDKECGWFTTSFNTDNISLSNDKKQFALCGELTIHSSLFEKSTQTLYVLAHPKRYEHDSQLYKARSGETLQVVNVELGSQWRKSSIDIHPQNELLLITAHSLSGKAGVFVYHTSTGKIEQLKEFDTIVAHAIWAQNGEGILYLTSAPNSRLMYQPLDSHSSTLIANVNERLCCNTVRHPNGVDYVFISSDKNIDIKWLSTNYALDNSSVIDREPLFAHSKTGHYFLSDRSGHTQVYYQAPNEAARLVTELAHNSRIKSMALSDDDAFLLLRDIHRLWLVPTQQESQIKDTFIDGYIYDQNWLSTTLFAITIKQQDQKQVWIMNTDMQKVAQLHSEFSHIFADPKHPDRHYYVDKESNLYRASPEQIFANVQGTQLLFIGGVPEFSKLLIEDNILYVVSLYGETLSTYKIGDTLQPLAKQSLNAYLGFDVKDGQVIYAGKTHYRSEVYRTIASK
ncbi:winged helix-turn-helix domain-containing protein [Pseudoalteromonas sp. S16_S37]|uniref:winged helix-turn-helix domain-containing protein n=1 Tax=Pseudoalteromonas sp. S16_S37 TaxID=2720228 RepID=UPI00167FFFFA|nr:winged helix-turn-helix domain-containing protein [Pseudoalteromonas sp. S16_S37]MBD1584232.1 hypothetical protein [Pseudoalteromonas sp. S16_S37]